MGGERERGLERKNGRFKSSEYIEKLLLVSVLKNKGVWVGGLSSLVFAPWGGVIGIGAGTVAYTPCVLLEA